MVEKEDLCPICLSDIVDGINLCADKSHSLACRECLILLIQNAVDSSYFGACPCISCPSAVHHKSKKKRVLLFDEWRKIVQPTVSSKYSSLANSLLAFLCGGCHALKSLDVGSDCDPSSSNNLSLIKYFTDNPGKGTIGEFHSDMMSFVSAEFNVEVFYQKVLNVYFPLLQTGGDIDSWELFVNILKCISDPERRANLHLRYLRDRPRIKTMCCSREHCFKCKTKDFHEGKSCVENSSSLDHSVVCCPTCGISLAKGDGCNTVTCVCGKQFSWSAEKENSERCVLFAQDHPEDTSVVCANLLCTVVVSSELLQAKAWQIRHRVDVNRALVRWFKQKYWPCPSQSCVVLAMDKLPDGVKEAAELWRLEKKQEVDKCRTERDAAISSLFTSLHPIVSERPSAAFTLINESRRGCKGTSNFDKSLVASAAQWVENNREVYVQGVDEMELRSAKQFLFLYGSRTIASTRPSSVSSPCAVEWDRASSNADLTYSNGNTTVERVGSVSCYPAAFATISSERAMFRAVVETAPKSSNWLTFGVAARGMANSSSDGVGRTANSWGLSDDRSAASGNSILAASGTEVGTFRKLRVGDELTAVIDTLEGWVEVTVNDQELFFKFDIPPGAPADYLFAMSFANDHRVTILCDVADTKKAPQLPGLLNSDHTRMLHSLRKQLRALLTDASDGANLSSLTSTIKVDGQEWVLKCGGSAEEKFKSVEAEICAAANIKPDASVSPTSFDATLSWNDAVAAASWYRENREMLAHRRTEELATTFFALHGDDAPFIAAINLVEYHTHRVDREEHQASLAFMKVFPEVCADWYEYDFHSAEPMIEHVAKDCLCLPRHCKACPRPAKRG